MTIKIAQERHRYIIQEIRSSGSVSTLDLARTLRVSGETIRRDFAYLEQQGFLHRVYGGAILTDLKVTTEPGFHERRAINPHAKSEIGRTAAELLNDETSIFIDVGTTAETIAAALPPAMEGNSIHKLSSRGRSPPLPQQGRDYSHAWNSKPGREVR
ncbi:DeoR/GlpR family DNA-binding transcription regulator [Gleimia europaea]|uniref:DeoR/GlpR family DNA-binding transcription regulator n=1 Tax=Gleimia europaea TaxID=66228 RepID=UPI003522441E